jgi:RNA polymerase sigma-70 factor (ECF subfamily)
MGEEDFEDTFRRFSLGEEVAAVMVIGAISERLRRFVFALVRDEVHTRDIAQEAFVTLWMRRSEFTFASSDDLFRWMCGVALNKCRRHQSRQPRANSTLPLKDEDEAVSNRMTANPHEKAVEMEELAIMEEAVLALPLDFREVIILRYYAGFSIGQIAEITDLTPGGVRSRLHRARLDLRAAVAQVAPSLIERLF